MGIPLYIAFLPEQDIHNDISTFKDVLPKDALHRVRVNCLGKVLATQFHLCCPHISVLHGDISMPSSLKDFDRIMINVAGLVPPRLPISLYPQVNPVINEISLVPDSSSDITLREIRESIVALLGVRLKSLEYRPHVSLASLKFGLDHSDITRRIEGMKFIFRVLSIHCCLEGLGKNPHLNTFRPHKGIS